MNKLLKYILAFFVGMIPVLGISYLVFCRWMGHELRVVVPKFGAFTALIAAIYWSLYGIREIKGYRRRLRYITYILFVAGLIFAALIVWWAHAGSGVSWQTELAILAITAACIAGTLRLFYRNATRRRIGMRPDDVE